MATLANMPGAWHYNVYLLLGIVMYILFFFYKFQGSKIIVADFMVGMGNFKKKDPKPPYRIGSSYKIKQPDYIKNI